MSGRDRDAVLDTILDTTQKLWDAVIDSWYIPYSKKNLIASFCLNVGFYVHAHYFLYDFRENMDSLDVELDELLDALVQFNKLLYYLDFTNKVLLPLRDTNLEKYLKDTPYPDYQPPLQRIESELKLEPYQLEYKELIESGNLPLYPADIEGEVVVYKGKTKTIV
jgi:hypothetical protein